MTTIVYRDGIIATDSRNVMNDMVLSNSSKKMIRRGDVLFFLSGASCDFEDSISLYLTGERADKHSDRKLEMSGLVYDSGIIYLIGFDSKQNIWKDAIPYSQPAAIGTGSPHALTAFDMGADVVKAVEMAILRDINSGGAIVTYDLEKITGVLVLCEGEHA